MERGGVKFGDYGRETISNELCQSAVQNDTLDVTECDTKSTLLYWGSQTEVLRARHSQGRARKSERRTCTL